MKIVEFGDDGKPLARDRIKVVDFGAGAPARKTAPEPQPVRKSSDIRLYMFQTGTLRTKLKYIKMNQG